MMFLLNALRYFKVSTRLCSTRSLLHRSCESKIESCNNTQIHVPVMVEETLKYLNLSPGDTIIDMTFGAGGHSKKILESIPDVKVFALDRDEVAISCAKKLAERYPGQVIPLVGRFSELLSLLKNHNVKKNSIDGILFDFGCSSMQFNTPARGFMISKNGPLDMRMDGFRCPDNPTAADILAKIEEKDLYCILKCYGEEKRAKKIARAIIDARYTFRNLRTTHELAQLVESLFPDETNVDSLGRFQHSATKTFQALRIFVNNELNEINYAMIIADKLLKISGRLVTISFHSLEDTIVKRHIFGNVKDGMANQLPLKYINYGKTWDNQEDVKNMTETSWKMLHKHVLMASNKEVSMNPRSRSAKFRGIIKIK
ncbi:PREDICTED: probable methyltransferase-like protein 15 homolog [Ceratosolen solmsi marchali]|uniref:Probable methyltransferase-like protein 15 homolog n=1 Tax=Ceratosolen solmsi marchali TaxID=326594 RepID=A0AAJ6YI76_9HYME|nr:PREDICTED: probable methyltransferase-like protein 15 homolog [Ceratosolen solmsi marchali]